MELNEQMYYITHNPFGEGYVILAGQLLFDNFYSRKILNYEARLYAVFDSLEQQTRSTNKFVIVSESEEIYLHWTDTCLAKARDILPIPIPLTLIRQTTNVASAELILGGQRREQDERMLQDLQNLLLVRQQQSSNSTPIQNKVQKRIADLVIQDAIKQELTCSITMNPLTLETATCVAPCYHIFDKNAITTWLETKNTCPECRVQCSL